MNKHAVLCAVTVSQLWIAATSASSTPVTATITSSAVVRYSDLNLASSDGGRVMLARIKQAARRICDPEPTFREFAEYSDWRKCMTKSVDEAVGRLDSPMVTLAYRGTASARTRLAAAD